MTEASSVIQQKWGRDVLARGFQVLPDALFRYQPTLGTNEDGTDCPVTAAEMIVLLNILAFWWGHDRPVFPSATLLAERIGVDRRSVDRSIQGLVKKQVLRKTRRGQQVHYDPSGLVEKLKSLVSRTDHANEHGDDVA